LGKVKVGQTLNQQLHFLIPTAAAAAAAVAAKIAAAAVAAKTAAAVEAKTAAAAAAAAGTVGDSDIISGSCLRLCKVQVTLWVT
jgi:hypothetical protein